MEQKEKGRRKAQFFDRCYHRGDRGHFQNWRPETHGSSDGSRLAQAPSQRRPGARARRANSSVRLVASLRSSAAVPVH